MINKDKIVFNTQIYFTCSYSGATAVKILKLFDDGCVLVQASKKPFIRPIQYVYNQYEHARIGSRDWEHYERKRKKSKQKRSKRKNNFPIIRKKINRWIKEIKV